MGNITTVKKEPEDKPRASPKTRNGKGDSPRNCFSDNYRTNFGNIDWTRRCPKEEL